MLDNGGQGAAGVRIGSPRLDCFGFGEGVAVPGRADAWADKRVDAIPSTLRLWDGFFRHVRPRDRIVDIGCGLGATVMELHQRGYRFSTGIDINQAAVAAARRSAESLGLPPGLVTAADARRTELASGSFDAAIMQALLCVLADAGSRAQAVKEAARLLTPGSLLHIADFLQAWHVDLYRERYLAGESKYGETGTFDAVDSAGKDLYVAHHFSERELAELLRSANFTIEEFAYRPVVTRSGNSIYGFVAIGRRLG